MNSELISKIESIDRKVRSAFAFVTVCWIGGFTLFTAVTALATENPALGAFAAAMALMGFYALPLRLEED